MMYTHGKQLPSGGYLISIAYCLFFHFFYFKFLSPEYFTGLSFGRESEQCKNKNIETDCLYKGKNKKIDKRKKK